MANLVNRRLGQLPGRSREQTDHEPSPQAGLVRRRREKDLTACARLLEVVYYQEHYPVVRPHRPRDWLTSSDVLAAWVAEHHGEILGHVAISRVGRDPVSALRWRETTEHEPSELLAVSRFFVRSRSRRQGVGTALLDAAVAEIRRRGCEPVIEMASESRDGLPFLADRHWRLIAMDPLGNAGKQVQLYRYALPREPAG